MYDKQSQREEWSRESSYHSISELFSNYFFADAYFLNEGMK